MKISQHEVFNGLGNSQKKIIMMLEASKRPLSPEQIRNMDPLLSGLSHIADSLSRMERKGLVEKSHKVKSGHYAWRIKIDLKLDEVERPAKKAEIDRGTADTVRAAVKRGVSVLVVGGKKVYDRGIKA